MDRRLDGLDMLLFLTKIKMGMENGRFKDGFEDAIGEGAVYYAKNLLKLQRATDGLEVDTK